MAQKSLSKLVREKLVPVYGNRSTEALLRRWWDDPARTANDKRKFNLRTYWVAYGTGGAVPANSLTNGGHNLTIGGHYLVWS